MADSLAVERRIRDPLAVLRARLALGEALQDSDPGATLAALRGADSLLALTGPEGRFERPRRLRLEGAAFKMKSQFAAACSRFRAAVEAAEALDPPDHAEVGLNLLELGFSEAYTDSASSARHLREAVERLESELGLADERTISVSAWAVANEGDAARTPEHFTRLTRVREYMRDHGLANAAVAWEVDLFLGRLAGEFGRFDEAIALDEHAIDVSRRWLGPGNLNEMMTWNDLAIWNRMRGRFDEAERCFRTCLELAQRFPRSLAANPMAVRASLAGILALRGKLDEARSELQFVIESRRSNQYEQSHLFVRLAEMCRALADTAAADSAFLRAIAIDARANAERETPMRTNEAYAAFLLWSGRRAEAIETAARVSASQRELIDETVPWLEDAHALGFASLRRAATDVLLSTLSADPDVGRPYRERVFLEVAGNRGLLLEALLRRRGPAAAQAAGAAPARAIRRELASLVLAAYRAGDSPAARSRRDSLRTVLQAMESSGDLTREEPPTLAALSRRLGGAALVSFVRHEKFDPADSPGHYDWPTSGAYAAFVLAPGDSGPAFVRLGHADSLEAAVSAWRAAIADPRASRAAVRAAGVRLRQLAWDPIEPALGGAREVYVVPDGALQLVNFAALPAGSGWLIEQDLLLHRIGHERDLLRGHGERPSGRRLLALGGADYERASGPALAAAGQRGVPGCRVLDEARFVPLGGSRAETGAIARLLGARAQAPSAWDVTLLTGESATEAAFKNLAPGRRVVHLATHGFFLDPDCTGDDARRDLVRGNPLVFSGLVLAGANHWKEAHSRGEEDGILTAEELAGIDLRGTEWLVLSGCDSGLGQLQASEGVFGLPRAARRAGVGTVIMSLSAVDDEATRYWMEQLYRARFQRGLGTGEAVREASRATLALMRRLGLPDLPRDWGAFVAVEE